MIRELTSKDAQDLIGLLQELGEQGHNILNLEAHLGTIQTNENTYFFGYQENSRIVAICTIAKIESLTYNQRPFVVIESLYVLKEFRNKGIAKSLIHFAIQQAHSWNCYKIILETSSQQPWKHKFYENSGFSKGEKTAFIKRFN